MDFLLWHYSVGIRQYVSRWGYALKSVLHFFSLGILLKSLFSPWKRLATVNDKPGFSFERWFSTFTFNLISRWIGAATRLTLFVFGTLILLPIIVFGLIGLVFWFICPLIGIPYYVLAQNKNNSVFIKLIEQLKQDPAKGLQQFLSSTPGKFLLLHLNKSLTDIQNISQPHPVNSLSTPTLSLLVDEFLKNGTWDRPGLRKINLEIDDIKLTAKRWDHLHEGNDVANKNHPRPGIGLELLFGYTPTLNQYGTQLSTILPFAHHLIGREELVNRMSRILENNKGIVLFGVPGVGKKTVVLELAYRAMMGNLNPSMLYKRVVELDYNVLLSQSFDLNQKKTLLSNILTEATQAGNIILVIKDIHRLTNIQVEGIDLTDVFEAALESQKLLLIALSSQIEYERFIVPNQRLRKYLEPVEVPQVSKDQALEILIDFAARWEHNREITITTPAIRAIISGSDKYISDTPFPEKALELLDNAVAYSEKTSEKTVLADDVNAVIAETTGISLARLTEKEKTLLSNLEEIMHQRLIGQDSAVTAIAKSLRSRSVGTKSENRPLGSFLFLGPTGVGKTEAAKTLANVYYESEDAIIRFDMAEFAGIEGLERLIGSVSKNTPGVLTTAIKNHPASLLLLDEIEKAPKEVYNLFLSLLDEGTITDAFGKKINCKHVFVIATSNAGSEVIRKNVELKTSSSDLQHLVLEYVQQQQIFTPEFLNRFDSVVVFEPLTPTQTERISNILLNSVVKSLESQDITLQITPELISSVAREGFEPQFGARPLRRLIDLEIGDVLGKAILTKQVLPGDRIKIVPLGNKNYSVEKL